MPHQFYYISFKTLICLLACLYVCLAQVYDFDFIGGTKAYKDLCQFFFQMHDPTTFNRQGNDAGTQYASVIYCYSKEQFDIANAVRQELQTLVDDGKVSTYSEKTIKTDIRMATLFHEAKSEHQDYLAKNPRGYCNHRIRFQPWPSNEPTSQ
jgi:peptide-methionine (S)-S-oxide reductase